MNGFRKLSHTASLMFCSILLLTGCATAPSNTAGFVTDETIATTDATADTSLQQVAAAELAEIMIETPANDKSASPPNSNNAELPAATSVNKIASDLDLWQRVREGFILPASDHPSTQAQIRWYASHQEYLDRTVERARPYLYLIVEEALRQGVPTEIALLPVVESAFQPFAYSHGRAAGLWQFIPSTGRIYGLRQDWWYDGRRDIEASTIAAITYLKKLNQEFDGDWLLALAAYNSGQGTVKKAIRKNERSNKPTDFWSLKLPRETRGYVPKLLAISSIINDPLSYGVTIPPVLDEPYLTKVSTDTQIDLALAADLAGLSIQELYQLNPAFNRWATSPQGPHTLLLPVANAADFALELAALPESERIQWQRHKIEQGETLGLIAEKYHTTTAMLRQVNKLRGNMIRAGHNLIIPVARKQLNNYTLSAGQRTRTIQNASGSGHKISYIVRKGDSLWTISQQHNVSVHKLAKWNAMAPRDILKEGQKLVIWLSSAIESSDNTPSFPGITQKINYTVRSGDSLARISQKFNVKVSQLVRWNSLSKNKYLQPGQKLTLFVDITRQAERI